MMEQRSREARALADDEDEELEEVEELEHHPVPIERVSPTLRRMLLEAPVGLTGMRSVRAIGPQGQRYTAGLYGNHVYLLELPWPNPRNICHYLAEEPPGVEWQPYSAGTREV